MPEFGTQVTEQVCGKSQESGEHIESEFERALAVPGLQNHGEYHQWGNRRRDRRNARPLYWAECFPAQLDELHQQATVVSGEISVQLVLADAEVDHLVFGPSAGP